MAQQITLSCLALCCVLAISACDKVVRREIVNTREAVGSVSCRKVAVCFTCMVGIGGGKGACGLKLSPMCPGRQSAQVLLKTEHRWHESGKESEWTSQVLIKRIGGCV
jgi:hypothetical protein